MSPLPCPMSRSATVQSLKALIAVHASVGRAVMRLGIGELQLQKRGLLLQMQSLAKISCRPAKVILLRPLHSLLPSATKKAAVSVSLSRNLEDECDSTS